MSGKGDVYRPVDKSKWDENYDLIFGKKRKKCGYADKYKAKCPPTCGCVYCNKLWSEKNK
jgi:hypothetical protein